MAASQHDALQEKLNELFAKQNELFANRFDQLESRVRTVEERGTERGTERLRDSRSLSSRESEVRQPRAHEWGAKTNLTAPKPRPGYAQLWARFLMNGQPDYGSLDKCYNEGWRPRTKETLEDKTLFSQTVGRALDGYPCDGTPIQIRGMLLMERPLELQEEEERRNRESAWMLERAVYADIRSHNRQGKAHRGFTPIVMEAETARGGEPLRRIQFDD